LTVPERSKHSVVERTFAWLHSLPMLRTRYEGDERLQLAFMLLAARWSVSAR
jgi:DDE family transposase